MDQLTLAGALLVWGAVPGLALLYTLGIGWSAVEKLAAAPGLSLAIVALAAYATEAIGVAVTPMPVAVVVALICAGAHLIARARPHDASSERQPPAAPFPDSRWLPWLIFLLPQLIVRELEPISTVTLLPPSLHDGLDHANWFRLIFETHSLNPHEVMAPPLAPDGRPQYYPWGLHGWLALVAQTTTMHPVAVLMQGLVLISAVLPLSVFVFVAQFTGRGWPAIAAAAFTLLFWWLPYQTWAWGGYPLLAGAVAALPFSRLALDAFARRHLAAIAATAVCAIGLLLIHPSQAFAALIVTTAVTVTMAATGVGRWRTALPFIVVLAAGGAAMTIGAIAWDPLQSFLEMSARVGATLTRDPGHPWPVGAYFDSDLGLPTIVRVVMGVLYVTGAAYAWRFKATRPLLILHIVFSLLIPAARFQTWLTALWYHSPERLWYAQCAVLPAFAALGIAAIVKAIERLLTRWPRVGLLRWVLWPALLWATSGIVSAPYANWAALKLFQHAQRNPNQTITDRRLLADFRWIEANIPAGEVLFNAPADWGLPLAFTGHRTVFWSGGHAMDPVTRWYDLLAALGRGDPVGSQAAAELRGLGIHHVYAASLGPVLERDRQVLDAGTLKATARLQTIYESPTATLFRIPDDGAVRFGVGDSDRVQFVGFHAPEERSGRQWRWTAGDGRVRIRTAGLPAGDCVARIHGPDPAHYFLRVDDVEFPLTARGYVIPEARRQGDALELLIRVPEPIRRTLADGAAPRTVGVRVTNVELRCGR